MKNALIACGMMLFASPVLGNTNIAVDSAVDSSGNIVSLAQVFIPGSPMMFDYMLAKHDSAGNLTFKLNYAGADMTPTAVALDGSGNIYLVGAETQFFTTNQDYFLAKYNSSGTLQWTRSIDKGYSDLAWDVQCDSSGNVYMTGQSAKVGGDHDGWLFKYDSGGTLLWQKADTTSSDCYFDSLQIDSSGNAFTVGRYFTSSEWRLRVEKWNSSGTNQYVRTTNGYFMGGIGQKNTITLLDSSQDLYIVVCKRTTSSPIRGQIVAQKIANSTGTQTTYSYPVTSPDDHRPSCARINSSSELFIGGNKLLSTGAVGDSIVLKLNSSMTLASDDFFTYGHVRGIELGSALQGYLLYTRKEVSGIYEIHINNITYAGSLIGNIVFSAGTNDYLGFSDSGGGYTYFVGNGYAPGFADQGIIVGQSAFGPNINWSLYEY